MYEKFEKRLHRQDFMKALEEVNTFVDITVDDLMDLNSSAEKFARMRATESQRVDSLMSQPVETVRPDCSLAEAAHLLVTHKVSGLPVVDDRENWLALLRRRISCGH
jgi:CBS domain-containing membrane protein